MIINNQTKLFFSISSTPGNTGAKFHNFYYKKYNFNNIYIPLKLKNLSKIKFLKTTNTIGGFSVSMPFKQKILKYIDKIDNVSKRTQSVNTVKIINNKFYGFNTDYNGSKKYLKNIE